MICPMRNLAYVISRTGEYDDTRCDEVTCGWYDLPNRQCAIVTLAQNLGGKQ